MRSRTFSYRWHKLKVGCALRCPHCERGHVFHSRFRLHERCPWCGCRFERSAGDAIGGIYLTIALAEFTALCGFALVHLLFEPPMLYQLPFWLIYVILFTTLFYQQVRGLWLAFLYLTGSIYPDMDCDHEYISAETVAVGKTPQELE
jgi:uncharacterized protein (DUF983 family)